MRLLQEEFDTHFMINKIKEEEEEEKEEEEARVELRKLDKLRATQKNASLQQSSDNLRAELAQNKGQFVKNPQFTDAERQQIKKIFDTYRYSR